MAARNFTCCAGLLRMQIDTAARLYALTRVDDMNALCAAVLSGARLTGKGIGRASFSGIVGWSRNWGKSFHGFPTSTGKHPGSFTCPSGTYSPRSWRPIPQTRHIAFPSAPKTPNATEVVGTLILGYVTPRTWPKPGRTAS